MTIELQGRLFKFREGDSSINLLNANNFEISVNGSKARFEIYRPEDDVSGYGLVAPYFLPIAKICSELGRSNLLHGLILRSEPMVHPEPAFSRLGYVFVNSDTGTIAETTHRIPDWEPPSSWTTQSLLQTIRLI